MKKKVLGRIVVVSVLIMLLLAPFSTALASPPERWYWEGSGSDPGNIDCGDFVIDGQWSSWERGTNFFDNDGNLTDTKIHVHFLGKLTNHNTGLTIRDDGYLTIKIDYIANTETDAGLFWSLNVPGHGVVALDAGNLVWDTATGELLHEGGPHQVLLDGLDVDATLCTYLRG